MKSASKYLAFTVIFLLVGCRRGPGSYFPPDKKLDRSAFAVQVQMSGTTWVIHLTNNSGQAFTRFIAHMEPRGALVPPAKIEMGEGWKAGEMKTYTILMSGSSGNKLRFAFGGSDPEHPYKESAGYWDGSHLRPTYYNYDQEFSVNPTFHP